MPSPSRRLAVATTLIATLLIAIFAATVIPFSVALGEKIRQAMVERDAAVLHPVALQQLAEFEASASTTPISAEELMSAALKSARQQGMLAVITFDAQGELLQAVPSSVILPELAPSDYLQLSGRTRISRFHPHFALDRHFRGIAPAQREAPVLEVLLPLHSADPAQILGFAQYFIDARALAGELAALDGELRRQTLVTLAIGAASIAVLGAGAYFGLRRAQRLIAERSERLARANFELTLAAKASALGQITSHLIHGLQGPVAGLRAVVAGREGTIGNDDWQTAADYTKRLDKLIRETVDLLSDVRAQATYELSGKEIMDTLRQRCAGANRPHATVYFAADNDVVVDNHRGSLLCLIAGNLIQNATEAASAGGEIAVRLTSTDEAIRVVVSDDGPGIPESIRARLFEPGCSGRNGGTGLGLAISRLLARQIGATLTLESTGAGGTTFALTVPNYSTVGS
jgi:signal transduction histidine kinase